MIRWGIIGAGVIAHRFAESLKNEEGSVLYAISGRNREKMEAFKEKYPCEVIYTSFDELLSDENVDVVYVALPHKMHKEWSVKALKAHKAVLCEKPATINAAEMEEIIAVSKAENTLFMEAMKTRFIPGYIWLKEQIAKGVIGEVISVDTSICYKVPEYKTDFLDPATGGPLRDSGIYCMNYYEDMFEGMPVIEDIKYEMAESGMENYVKVTMDYAGVKGHCEVAFDRTSPRDGQIYGTRGEIYITDLHRPTKFRVNGEEVVIPYDHDDFYSQIHHFCDLYRNGKKESDVMPLNSSLRMAQLLELKRGEIK